MFRLFPGLQQPSLRDAPVFENFTSLNAMRELVHVQGGQSLGRGRYELTGMITWRKTVCNKLRVDRLGGGHAKIQNNIYIYIYHLFSASGRY